MEGPWPRRAITAAEEAQETAPWSAQGQNRLIGEDAPVWLPVGFAVVGTLIAIASAWTWLSPPAPAQRPAVAASPATTDRDSHDRELAQRQRRAGTQENAAVAATPMPEREAPEQARPQPDRNVAPGAPICFSAFNIPFAYDSSTPIIKGLEQPIESLRRWMIDHPDAILSIEGHTDTTGTEQYNILLSFSRAKAVASLLSHLGVPERRITVRAAGAIAATDKPGEIARNRRAFLRVEGVENCGGAYGEMEKQ